MQLLAILIQLDENIHNVHNMIFLIQLPISPTKIIELTGHAEVFTEPIVMIYTFFYPIDKSFHVNLLRKQLQEKLQKL